MYRLNEPAMEEIERDYKDPLISTAWKQRQMKFMIDEIRASWKEREELRMENEELKRNLSKPRNLIYDQYFGLCKSNSELMTRVSELEGELRETVIQLTEEISKTVPPATLD